MTVLVAIPYFGCAPYIEQAIAAVLAQSHRDLVCLVAGDGEEPPLAIADPRLRVVTFPVNRGAPFTQQAMLMGSPFEWYAAHGADDWTEPDYLERLLGQNSQAAGSAAVWHHPQDGAAYVQRDRAHVEFGVFATALLRSLGGYGAERRCGMDTLLYEDILPRVSPIAWCDYPGMHKRLRPDSLTHAPETTFGTPYRNGVFEHNAEVRWNCERIGYRDLEAVRAYRASLVPADLRAPLAECTEIVRRALA